MRGANSWRFRAFWFVNAKVPRAAPFPSLRRFRASRTFGSVSEPLAIPSLLARKRDSEPLAIPFYETS